MTRSMMKAFSIVLVLLVLTLIAGCAPPKAAPTPQQPAGLVIPANAKIVVRASADLSGATAATQKAMVLPADDYFKYLNEQGGIAFTYQGKQYKVPVDFVVADDKYDLAGNVANYKKFLADNPHFVFFNRSGPAETLAPDAAKDQVPIIAWGVGDGTVLYNPGWVFGVCAIYGEVQGATIDWIKANWKEQRAPRFAFLISDNPSGWGLYTNELKAYMKQKGVEIVRDTPWFWNANTVDVTAELTAIKQLKPDYVFAILWSVGTWTVLLRDAKAVGLTPPGGGTARIIGEANQFAPAVLEAVGDTGNEAIGYIQYALPTDNVPAWNLGRELAKKYRGQEKFLDIMDSVGAVYGHLVEAAAKRALEQKGWPVTGSDIYAALQTLKGDNLGGLIGPLNMSTTERRCITSAKISWYKDGKFQTTDWLSLPIMKPGTYAK